MHRVTVVSVALQLALAGCYSQQLSSFSNDSQSQSAPIRPTVSSTAIEKALDELRSQFPNSIVIGFEELIEPRPDNEPELDLGPRTSSLEQVLNRVRRIAPQYHVELLHSRLVRVYPIRRAADPLGLLDIRLREFSMPQDSCLLSAVENIDRYAPELSQLLWRRKEAWYQSRHRQVLGVVGDTLGNCFPEAAPGPVYRNITVRDSLNLLVKRSLEVSRREVTPNSPLEGPYHAISWKFRFRPDADADTGLGGRPLFQTF